MKPEDLSEAQRKDLTLAFDDHSTFCREALSIQDLGGSITAFECSPGQLKLNAAIRRIRKQGKPVRLVVLKTRRSWFTSGCCAEMFHDVPFFPGRKGLIIADKKRPAGLEAFGYLLQFQRRYKPFGRHGARLKIPRLIKDTEEEIGWDNASNIQVLSAEAGEVRGAGKQWILCDEVAFWRDAQATLTGVLNMVPKVLETTVVVQSTANGIGGAFYELCQQAQDPLNESGWEFLFFGWLEHPVYRSEFATLEEKGKFQQNLNTEEKTLQSLHGATLEQLKWRRLTIATECLGSVDTFHQEYPTTPEEAFLASGRPVFDHQVLMRHPVVNGEAGELEIIEESETRKRLLFIPSQSGALMIFQRPQTGRRYVCGADPSKGIDVSAEKRGRDPDYSVGFLADAGTGRQVALLRARLRPIVFAEYLARLCRWYNWAFMVPEANDAGFIDAIVRTGYPLESIYQRQRDPTDRKSASIQELGFETTGISRDWLIAACEDAIRNLTISIASAVVVNECVRFVIKANGKKEHQEGSHDDTVMALGLAELGRRLMPRVHAVGVGVGRAKIGFYGRPRVEDDDD